MGHGILIAILATLPLTELRGSIPIGVFCYKLPVQIVFLWSVFGNLLPVFPLLLFFNKVVVFIRRHTKILDKILDWLDTRTKSKAKIVKKIELLGLFLLVAIPLPGTGAWTGCFVANFLNLNKIKAFVVIGLGILAAGIIVSMTIASISG